MDEPERPGPMEIWLQRQPAFTAIQQAQKCAMHSGNHATFVDLSRLFLQSTRADTVTELANIEAQARAYLRQLQSEG